MDHSSQRCIRLGYLELNYQYRLKEKNLGRCSTHREMPQGLIFNTQPLSIRVKVGFNLQHVIPWGGK